MGVSVREGVLILLLSLEPGWEVSVMVAYSLQVDEKV